MIHLFRLFIVALGVAVLGTAMPVLAAEFDPQKLLEQVDDNIWSTTKYIEGRLVIDNGRKTRSLSVDSWMEGVERSYSFYKSPPREMGTKMLKVEGNLWMYTPRTDRKILIAGHMLRQSMMGSDLSYEDMMEDKKLSRVYKAELEKMEEIGGIPCAVLMLTAHDETTTYHSRRLWVDPERRVVVLQHLFAKSGKLLKQIEFEEYHSVGTRLFPRRMVFRDLLKENTQTTYHFDVVEFDVEIPSKYFSQSILKR